MTPIDCANRGEETVLDLHGEPSLRKSNASIPKGMLKEEDVVASIGEFEDANSDMDGFMAGLDSILADAELTLTPSAAAGDSGGDGGATTPLTPSELDASTRVRRKYGLPSTCPDDNGEDSTIRERKKMTFHRPKAHIRILVETMQVLVSGLMEELANGGVIECDHPWLSPLLAVLEIILWHGFNPQDRPERLWKNLIRDGLFRRNKVSRTVLENVANFTLLKTPWSRIRAWLRLSLMNKCLASDLAFLLDHHEALITEIFLEWACLRSEESMQTIIGLISILDAIDFNLYFREQDISLEALPSSDKLFDESNGSLCWSLILPSKIFAHRLLSLTLSSCKEYLAPPSPLQPSLLDEENQRLRRALMMQINQRVYFQEEYSKSQGQLATALTQIHHLTEEANKLRKQLEEQTSLVSIHEETNASLQRQLSAAFSEATERDQVVRLRDAINHLSTTLEAERAAHRATKLALTDVIEEKARQEEYWQGRIESLQAQLREAEMMASDRIRLLTEQLKLAKALKNEYKRQLSPQ